MELPEVEIIGLEALETVLEFHEGVIGAAIVGAVLGHQERLLAVAVLGEGLAHPGFAFAGVVLPGVVEEVGAGIDRFLDDADTRRLIAETHVRSANAEEADIFT